MISPYCQLYNSYHVSSENFVLYQLIIPKLIFVFIPITCLVDIVLILFAKKCIENLRRSYIITVTSVIQRV